MFLGLDLGTSGLRGLLVTPEGLPIASFESPLSTQNPHSGWSEQDPQSWLAACDAVMKGLNDQNPEAMAALQGIGLSGHMHGATLLDGAGAPLRPCILWNDTRSAGEAAALDAQADFRAISGNIVFPGFTAPKLEWVRQNEPDIFARIAKVLLPKDFLRLYLTGEYLSEMSDSAGTAWLDVKARDWSEALLAQSHMSRAQMPDLIEGTAAGGPLRTALMQKWGIKNRVTVAAGAGDNAAAACGVGCLKDGQGFVSLGTSGVLLTARDRCSPAPETAVHSFCHALPERWVQMGVILSATDSLNWLARTLDRTPAGLAELAPAEVSGPTELIFLPYLSGERTPHNDAKTRASLIGLDISTGPEQMVQAVMEGVAYAMRDCMEALKATGARFDSLLAVGGGTRSPFWLKTLANILQTPLNVPKDGEYGAALGAARLAICAHTGAAPEEVMTPPEIAHTVAPETALLSAYNTGYQKYRALYPMLNAHYA